MSGRNDERAFSNLLDHLLEDEAFNLEEFKGQSDPNIEAVDALVALLDFCEAEPEVSPETLEESWQDFLRIQRREAIREGWGNCRQSLGEWFERTRSALPPNASTVIASDPVAGMARLLGIVPDRSYARTLGSPAIEEADTGSWEEIEEWSRSEAEAILRSADALFAPISYANIERFLAVVVQEARLADPSLEGCFVTDGKFGGITVNTDPRYVPSRRRYTWAHEIGHHVLHRGSPAAFRDDKHTLRNVTSGIEAEANIFASSLLIPQSLLLTVYRPSQRPSLANANAVESQFRVSPIAAMYRIVRVTELPCVLVVCEDGRMSWSVSSPAFSGEVLPRGSLPPPGSTSRLFVDKVTESQLKYHADNTPAEWWLRQGDYSYADESAFRVSERFTYTMLTFRR